MLAKRVNEIDLLRFLSAIAVVIFHYAFRGFNQGNMTTMHIPELEPIAKYGYLGVHLFFMISGFVICMSATGEGLQKFVTSRLTRLYPAFWICCSITAFIMTFLGPPQFSTTFIGYIENMTMLGAFIGVQPMDGAYWSLFIEIKFYLLITILILARQILFIERYLIAWLLLTIASVFLNFKTGTQWFITDYSSYFIAGGILFQIWTHRLTTIRAIALAGCASVSIYQGLEQATILANYYNQPFTPTVISCTIIGMYACMLAVAQQKTYWIGRTSWKKLGPLTYPLYLIHQYVGFMIFNRIGDNVDRMTLFCGVLLSMIVFSHLISQTLEKRLASAMRALLEEVFDRFNRVVRSGIR